MKLSLLAGTVLLSLASCLTQAQGKLKFGLGENAITNNEAQPHLYTYIATSVHINYTLFRESDFSLGAESYTSFKGSNTPTESKLGLTTALPVWGGYSFRKLNVLLGVGPAYLKQKYSDRSVINISGGYCVNFVAGAGFKLKPFFYGAFLPECAVRLSYFRNYANMNYDAAMLSLIFYVTTK